MTVPRQAAFAQGYVTPPRNQRSRRSAHTQPRMQSSLQARKRVADILATDLPRQYDAPNKLDWTIYDSEITFDDPMTQLRGKVMYKGMILSIAVIARVLFTSASFELSECSLLPDGDRVRTLFLTRGRTRWGRDVVISGVDYFWFGEGDTVVRHESTWDQTPTEVTNAFWGR